MRNMVEIPPEMLAIDLHKYQKENNSPFLDFKVVNEKLYGIVFEAGQK